MWRFVRSTRDEFAKPFANDLISAIGKLPVHAEFIRYHLSPLFPDFDKWVQRIFTEWQKLPRQYNFKDLPIIYGVTDEITDESLPALMMITPSCDAYGREYPFSAIRLLEHPLAEEFRGIVPWLYRDTQEAFVQLAHQDFKKVSLSDVLWQIENLKIFNSRLMRKSALEAIVYQLQEIQVETFWKSLQLPCSLSVFISCVTDMIKQYKTGHYRGIQFPLPNVKKLVLSGLIFWMQLLESVLKEKFNSWQIYWHEKTRHHPGSLIFYRGAMPADAFVGLWQPSALSKDIIKMNQTFADFHEKGHEHYCLSLLKLLSRWSAELNHEG